MRSYSLFIGIDISKNWIDVCLSINGQIKQMPHARFDNTKKGFAAMLRFIKQNALYPGDLKQCAFCMEHTGVYTLPICKFLQDKKLFYVLVSPYHLKRSLGLLRGKSDHLDAAYISRYAYLHSEELIGFTLPCDRLLKIKNLLSLRNRLLQSKMGLKVAAKELEVFAPGSISQDVNKHTKSIVKPLEKSIKAVEKQVKVLIQDDPALKRKFDLLISVKGVGLIIAAHLLVYTIGFTTFENSRKFATYIGIVPYSKTSGKSVNVPAQVSHLANKKLKGLISCGASSARMHDKELKAYYERRIAERKNKHSVQNAIRNKFLHRIWAVIKRGTPYVELEQFRG